MSRAPKVLIANAFSHSGAASIAAWPTVTMGDASGLMIPATSCAEPIATPAAISPVAAPTPLAGRPGACSPGPAALTAAGA